MSAVGAVARHSVGGRVENKELTIDQPHPLPADVQTVIASIADEMLACYNSDLTQLRAASAYREQIKAWHGALLAALVSPLRCTCPPPEYPHHDHEPSCPKALVSPSPSKENV